MGTDTGRISGTRRGTKTDSRDGIKPAGAPTADSVNANASGRTDGIDATSGIGGRADVGNRQPADPRTDKTESQAEIRVETAEVKKRKKRSTAPKPKDLGESGQAAQLLLGIVESFTTARFGADAAFNVEEKFLIEGSLTRLISKYGNLADKYGGWIDPLLLGGGMLLYGVRLAGMINEQNAPGNNQPPKPPDKPKDNPPSGLGNPAPVDHRIFESVGNGARNS